MKKNFNTWLGIAEAAVVLAIVAVPVLGLGIVPFAVVPIAAIILGGFLLGRGLEIIDFQGAWKQIQRWGGKGETPDLRFAFMVFIVLAVGGGALIIFLNESALSASRNKFNYENIRNVLYFIFISGALVGGWLVQRRNKAYDKEVALQGEQQRINTLARAIEHIGHKESKTICSAGILLLEDLGRKNKNDKELNRTLCKVLQGFLNEWIPRMDGTKEPSEEDKIKLADWRINISGAIKAFGELQKLWLEELEPIDLEHAFLTNMDLNDAKLLGARIWYSKFGDVRLSRTNFKGAQLRRTNFEGTILINTNLEGANLEDASFKRAFFLLANMKNANLRATRFYGVHLRGTDFANVNLKSAVYYETDSKYKSDMENNSTKQGKLITKKWLQEKNVNNWESVKGIPDE